MLRMAGRIVKVREGQTVRGAFGEESALGLLIERKPGQTNKDGEPLTDLVKVPDVPENRKALVAGALFDAEVVASAVPWNGSAFIAYASAFVAKG